jgi:hypothetical protein
MPIFARMNQAMIGKAAALLALLLSGLLFAQAVRSKLTSARSPRFSEKANLALRRTAHFLLTEAGDSTTRIPPVEQLDSNTWIIRLENGFSYERLPALLEESLDREGIRYSYDVSVLDCKNEILELGYTQLDFKEMKGVPCGGREPGLTCAILKIAFNSPVAADSWATAGLLLGGILLLSLAYLAWKWANMRPAVLVNSDSTMLQLGNSNLDIPNLILLSGGRRYNLTYREAKLLQLFVGHPNQLLEREFILKSVWEDEGILVGRSVDVFVSRLRKMFRDDPAVKWVAVHGLGYRMEVVAG